MIKVCIWLFGFFLFILLDKRKYVFVSFLVMAAAKKIFFPLSYFYIILHFWILSSNRRRRRTKMNEKYANSQNIRFRRKTPFQKGAAMFPFSHNYIISFSVRVFKLGTTLCSLWWSLKKLSFLTQNMLEIVSELCYFIKQGRYNCVVGNSRYRTILFSKFKTFNLLTC